jgi:hypothetical protein
MSPPYSGLKSKSSRKQRQLSEDIEQNVGYTVERKGELLRCDKGKKKKKR